MKIFSKKLRNFCLLFLSYAIAILILISYDVQSNLFYIIYVIFTLVILFVTYFLLRSLTKPIEKINSHLHQLTESNYSDLPEIFSVGFQDIYRNLNILTEQLKNYETKLTKQKEGFNVIIESIKEAIWVQNRKGLIRTYNTSFLELVQKKDIKNQYFWNVIREKELYDLADSIFKNPINSTKEINFENRHFLCSTSHSPLTEETVFILYNITEFRKLETIKKDFVLNVSHELRTPLTSIKGYLETLEEDLNEEQHAYVDVIKRNANRLVNIVNDLLTLSSLEHLQDLELENIVITDFIGSIVNIFELKLQEKNLELDIDIQSKATVFLADRYKFEQVIINLIDNAIKYTEEGRIKFAVKESDASLFFEISDNGCGIEEKHLTRLFERFYVVDKSHSRHLGGTGLGLSIVKHIVNLHNGTIDVESTIDLGTKFIIQIPKL